MHPNVPKCRELYKHPPPDLLFPLRIDTGRLRGGHGFPVAPTRDPVTCLSLAWHRRKMEAIYAFPDVQEAA